MLRREFIQGALTLGAGAMSWMLVPKLSAREAAREQVDVTLVGHPHRFAAQTGADFNGLAYNGRVPGQLLRVRYGQTLRARYLNRTGSPSTIHWHGMILPNDMDGVPDVTQKPVPNGGEFIYTFKPNPPGFRWYHSHVGDQIALGLFGPFLIEDPAEPTADVEAVLVLHDVPEMSSFRAALAGKSSAAMDVPPGAGGMARMSGQGASVQGMKAGMQDMEGMQDMKGMTDMRGMKSMSGTKSMGGIGRRGVMGDEVAYLSHCLSGAAYPHTRPLTVRVGQTVRLRILNASPTLTHYVRLGGHQLRITHTDGNPLPRAVTVDALRIGVGERYDAWFEVVRPGAWLLQSLMADPHDRRQSLLVRTPDAAGQEPQLPPSSLRGATCFDYLLAGRERSGDAHGASAAPADARARRRVSVEMTLGGGESGNWRWTVDGKIWPHTPKVQVRPGDQVVIRFRNANDMDHPMHLHGHIFELVELNDRRLANPLRKDTALVPAHGSAAWRFIADAPPGRWLLHCHNLVHMMDGMVTEVDYL